MKKQVELIAMHRIVNELDRRTAAIARKYGLTLPQFAVLEALYHKGDLSVGELKESVLSTDGTIPVVTRHLKQQGLIVGTTDSKDRRRTIMTLTDKGRASLPKSIQKMKRCSTRFLENGTMRKEKPCFGSFPCWNWIKEE